jgi:hypothetical protein
LLLLNQNGGSQNTADGVVTVFDESFSASIGNEDSRKVGNLDETMGINRNGVVLSIEGRPIIQGADTIPLKITRYRHKTYFFELTASNFSPGITAFVKDAFLKKETAIDLAAGTVMPFTITTDAASAASDRFSIVFKGNSVLPVTITNIKATVKEEGVKVDWQTKTESNIDRYEVERSDNAIRFTTVGSVTAKGNNSNGHQYDWLDVSGVSGTYYYRIKVIEKSGEVKYTDIVKVNIAKTNGSIAIFPNPIRGNTFSVKLKNMDKGRYNILLYNDLGQKVFQSMIDHNIGNSTYRVTIPTRMVKGSYKLHITNGDVQKTDVVIFE